MNIEELKLDFERNVAGASSPAKRVETIALSLADVFGVSKDEVAVFSFDSDREVLVFIWPHSLKSVGSIPLNAHRCLVARTAVAGRAELDNSFASTPHLYMFEHFLSEKAQRLPIQKIMSVPVMHGGQLKGVVQVARKGADRESAAPDFTDKDLAKLTEFVAALARYF